MMEMEDCRVANQLQVMQQVYSQAVMRRKLIRL